MKEAVAIEKRLAKAGVSKALRDVLSRCVGEYNKMVSKRSHKIDTPTKNLVMNMFLEQNTIDLLLVFSSMMFNGIKWCSTELSAVRWFHSCFEAAYRWCCSPSHSSALWFFPTCTVRLGSQNKIHQPVFYVIILLFMSGMFIQNLVAKIKVKELTWYILIMLMVLWSLVGSILVNHSFFLVCASLW